ncbi:MAG: hypothetical protein SPE27_09685 [Prevotella sp.]|nr:hypothetical protein [Prevotella sp.]
MRRNDRHSNVSSLDEHNLRVVLPQEHVVEAALHKPIELHRLASSLEVCDECGVVDKITAT